MLTQEDFLKTKKAYDNAQADDTPIAAIIDEQVIVSGDPNKTEVKPRDYTATFFFPEEIGKDFPDAEKTEDGYYKVTLAFKNVFVSAMDNMIYTSYAAKIVPFYNKLDEWGGVERLETQEDIDAALAMFQSLDKEVIIAMWELVASVLHVDDSIKAYMGPGTVLNRCVDIMQDFPFLFRSGDLFSD